MSGGIFTGMNDAIMGGMNAVMQGQASVYGTMISAIATSSFTSYILFRGYQTLGGKLHKPVEDVMWDIARMLLIMMFVLNLGGWLDITAESIDALKDGLSGSDNIWSILDTVWEKAQTLGQTLYDFDDSTYVKLNGGIAELLVWGGAMFVLGVTTLVSLLAEVTILLLSTTAPLFIFCLLYGFLRPMFDNWLKTIFTAILTIMFSALFVRISIKYTNNILDAANHAASDSNIVTLAAQSALAAIGAGIFVLFSAKLAMALGGAATQATMQAVAMSGIGSIGSSANEASKPLTNGLGKLGNISANNLTGNASPKAPTVSGGGRKASIQTMQRSKNQRNRKE